MKQLQFKKRQIGQAMVELAILGSLILLILSALLTYGQRLTAQQQIKMEAFRKALTRAYQRNSSVSYTLKRDTRFSNLLGGYREGQHSGLGASASVMWVKGTPGLQGTKGDNSFAFYEINDVMIGDLNEGLPRYSKTVYTRTGSREEIKAPVSIWKEDVEKHTTYSTQSKRKEEKEKEKEPQIINTAVADLKETIKTRLYTRFDKSETDPNKPRIPPSYVYEGQSYGDQTIVFYPPIYQGAYEQGAYENKINRIEYRQGSGENIHYERTWKTSPE